MHVLVTGGRGFIASSLVRAWAKDKFDDKTNITHLTVFARNTNDWTRTRLEDIHVRGMLESGRLRIVYGDLNSDISGLCEGCDAVLHLAAKTFVDHSIKDPMPFVETNVVGTMRLLEEANRQKVKAFIHISTDEVYGQILEGAYTEDAAINPRNPYAASKAGADALTISYHHTYSHMWTAVTRTENNYGPYQHPQKAIPVFVSKALNNHPIPVYGDGKHVRQWLHVDDHVQALLFMLNNWQSMPGGEVWHVAGNQELTNIDLATKICNILGVPDTLIKLIDDMGIRPGHDRRYALNCDKLKKYGWEPKIDLDSGLRNTVDWYKNHRTWLGC